MTGMELRICFIRHGETDWNVGKRIQGQIDTPLNARGLQQAHALAEYCRPQHFSAIYCSDLGRAQLTALRLAAPHGLSVRVTAALRERHFGVFQGLTASQAQAQFPDVYTRYKNRDPDQDFVTGESLHALARRVDGFLAELTRAHRNQTLAVVTHAGVLDAVYRLATGRPPDAPRDFPLTNCALNWLRLGESGWQVERWGEQIEAGDARATSVE